MGDWTDGDFPAALSRAQRKIEQWRQRHRPRGRIPEALWREAAELACAHGVNRTARALRLDYYGLKKRADLAAAEPGEGAPDFVEVLPGAIPASRPQCTIEVEEAGGVKMRICLQGGDLPDVLALTRVLREGRS
jgi:glycerol-3-phosphate responsive antiterminator